MKKKLVAGLLTALMLCTVGCGNGVTVDESSDGASENESSENEAQEEEEAPADETEEGDTAEADEASDSEMVVAFSQMEMNNACRRDQLHSGRGREKRH